jgi:hypothetical protein
MYKKRFFLQTNIVFVIVVITMFKIFTGCQEENDIIPETVPIGLKKIF